MRGCCLTTIQYQRVSVRLSRELKSPRGCLAQIKFQRVIIHLPPPKNGKKKAIQLCRGACSRISNYTSTPRRWNGGGGKTTADASTSKRRGRGEFAKDAPEAC